MRALAALLWIGLGLTVGIPFLPWLPRDELVRTSVWGLALLASFAGWGSLLARWAWPTKSVPLALRSVWGGSAILFVGGVLASASLLHRLVYIAIVAGGAFAFGWTQTRPDALKKALWSIRVHRRAYRLHLPVAVVIGFLIAAVAVHYFGAASDTWPNPYDDDISYYPLAKQLLQRGTLIDPFSYRRMSTLGGQSFFHATLLVHIQVDHVHVFDRGVCVVLIAGMLAAHRIEGKRVPLLVRLISILFFVGLPKIAINSASCYSGVAWFLALSLTLEAMPSTLETNPREAIRRVLPLALIGAATCTFRQNYQVAVAFIVLFSYLLQLRRVWKPTPASERRPLLIEPALALGLTIVAVAPWLVLLYRSNHTFLFPVMKGNLRSQLTAMSQDFTFGKIVRFVTNVWLAPEPVPTIPLFTLVGLFVRERLPRQPLAAQWLASILGVVMLAAGFTLSDAGNLARYDFGFLLPAALMTWHTVASRAWIERTTFRRLLPAGVLLIALFETASTNSAKIRMNFDDHLRDIDEMLRRSVPPQQEPPIAAAYHHIQDVVPKGERVLVMVDKPIHFDYARNEIWNLDLPGLVSPVADIPCFQGPEVLATYFKKVGIRYITYVESEHSTFLYRYPIWYDHIFDPDEIWRLQGPFMYDVMINVGELGKTRKHLHSEGGMILFDLDEAAPAVP